MNKDETKRLIAGIITAYPNYKPHDLELTVETWNIMLDEYSYNQCMMALKTFIKTDVKGFPPSIGQLINKIHVTDEFTELSEMEAWALVSKALRNSTYNAEAEFNKLPEVVQKAVGSASQLHNWATTSVESVENVIQSNFLRTYRTVLTRKKEFSKLPSEVKAMIQTTQQKMIGSTDGEM